MILVFATGLHREISPETFIQHRRAIGDFVASHFTAALLAYIAIYVAAVALSFPGAVFLTIAGGIVFGIWLGALGAIVGATIGSTIVFLVARSAFGEILMRRAGPFLGRFREGVRQDAFNYLLFLRLVPLFPFWLVNLAPALLDMPLRTFVAATFVGIIPGTFAFAFFGAGLDSVLAAQAELYEKCLASGRSDCTVMFDAGAILTPKLIAAFLVLGLFALVPVGVKRLRARSMHDS